jgi:hypothetical protein
MDLIHLVNAPLIQPVLPMFNNLSRFQSTLLAIEENKMSIKKALSALLEQFTIRNQHGISRLRFKKATITIVQVVKKRH